MDQNTLLLLESFTIAAFNVIAVYIAAISYSLPWPSVLMVMVLVSFITASMMRLVLSKMTKRDIASTQMGTIVGTLVIGLISSLAVFMILIYRFNIPMALGMSLLSGILTSFVRHLIN